MHGITDWVAIIISLLALIFNGLELHISNKQFVFNQRLKIYCIYKLLVQHQQASKIYFDEKRSFQDDMAISQLTNDSILYKASIGWGDKGPIMKSENQVNFLKKVEELHQYAEESFFFFGNISMKNFFDNYADLLMEIYKYRVERKNSGEKAEYSLIRQNIAKLYKRLVNYSEQIDDNKLRKQIYIPHI